MFGRERTKGGAGWGGVLLSVGGNSFLPQAMPGTCPHPISLISFNSHNPLAGEADEEEDCCGQPHYRHKETESQDLRHLA